ncbi:hypothetical protein ACFQ0M_48615 [Kitasatospora aburaviensis]|uniref:DUF8175 domain-containing protein n=1 Tax=Kitasatospora aburaviensis TaxID=67265 RepID=A0ABW1F3G3_9ACTN
MLADTERRRRSAMRRLVVTGVVLAAAAVGTGAVLLWGPGAGPTSTSTTAPAVAGSPAAAPPASTGPSTGVLPAPARVEQGIPVGYPHTPAGAVSAAAHYTEARDLLSPHLVAQQMRVMARHTAQDLGGLSGTGIADARDWRTRLGLDPDGGSDANSFIAVQVRGYQVEVANADQVDVWLLAVETPTVGGIAHGRGTFVVAAPVAWADGDWKLVDRQLQKAPESAEPDSSDAVSKGWIPVAYQR